MKNRNNNINYHHERVESQIMNLLNEVIREEIYNSSIKLASFTEVRLTSDYSLATIFVDTYDRAKIDEIVRELNKAKGIFKTYMAKNMSIGKIPDLKFVTDKSIDTAIKIDEIIKKI